MSEKISNLVYRVLIVDGNVPQAKRIQSLLNLSNYCLYESETCSDYEVVLEQITSQSVSFDLVLVGPSIGSHSGLDLFKEFNQRKIKLPVILLTQDKNKAYEQLAMTAGACDVLDTKNLYPELLDRSIRYSIEHRRMELMVTRQQKEIAAIGKMSALGELIHDINHEINNPLAIIQGRAFGIKKILEANNTDHTPVKGFIVDIINMVQKISDIKANLREQYEPFRVQKGNFPTLAALLNESLRLCEDKISKNKVRVHLELGPGTPDFLVNPDLSQVLVNLILNSCDATSGTTEPWLRIQSRINAHDLHLIISDSGAPILPEIRKQLFSRFFTTKASGTGLGLHISRKLVESQGGSLELNDQSKQTEFHLKIPSIHKRKKNSYNILIIDDDESIAEFLKAELTSRGQLAEVCLDSQEALTMLSSGRFDAVIADIVMPGQDGIELIKLAKQKNQCPPVVFISGYLTSKVRSRLNEDTSCPVFEKPFNMNQLLDQVLDLAQSKSL